MSELKTKWPELDEYAAQYWPHPHEAHYERARADAAIERLRVAVEALKVAEQARLEVQHAKTVGPGWYTRGEHGMHRQVLMWDGKAGNAVAEALAAIGPIPGEQT